MVAQLEIYWLGHAAFKLKTSKGLLIYLDPYQIKKGSEKADLIVSTHSHFDHFSAKDVKKLWKDGTLLIGPKSCEAEMNQFKGKFLEIGQTYEKKGVRVELVPSYTIQKSTHPKLNNWAGILIHLGDISIYHAGDTERIPEMKDLATRNITVELLPCGGTYTMDFEESTDAAVDIQPKKVIPMHNWNKDLNEFKEKLASKDPNIQVILLQEKGEPLRI